jgi:hypothetical protein
VEAGVPLLLIGKIPSSGEVDWSKWLGVEPQDGDPTGPVTQQVDSAWQQLPAARGLDQVLGDQMSFSAYATKSGEMQPVVQRSGRLAVGAIDQPTKKVVFYGLLYPLYLQDDAALRRFTVEAFNRMQKQVVEFDDQTGGYAFEGLDGALYAVVENHQSFATRVRLKINSPIGLAASVLTGERLVVTPNAGGTEVVVPLQADGATVVVFRQ